MFKKVLCIIPLCFSIAFAQKAPAEWTQNPLDFRPAQKQDAINYLAIKASLEVKNCYVDALQIIKNEEDFLLAWHGNICGGGNGTTTTDIAGITHDGIQNSFFNLSNFINTRFLTDIQVITNDEYVLTSYTFDENDTSNHAPSIQVKTRVTKDQSDDSYPPKWKIEKISSKKAPKDDDYSGNLSLFGDNKDELIQSYEVYNSLSNLLKFDNSIIGVEAILKGEGTPFLAIVRNNVGYKIMAFNPENADLNKDYFNYKYNNLHNLQSFKIIGPEYFEFTILDEESLDILITYEIIMSENGRWKTTEIKREEDSRK